MFYRLLGMFVWKGGKYFLKRKYSTYVPTPVLAGAAVAVAGGVALLIVRHAGSDD
jgi:hypothetical protein